MKSSWPLIFIQSDSSPNDRYYLIHTLAQAKASNPRSPIHMLCDMPVYFDQFAQRHSWLKYSSSAQRFADIYVHLSPLAPWYDLACIQRWFILRDFCVMNDISSAIYVESDVLLFSDFSSIQEDFAQFSMSLSHDQACPLNILPDTKILESFCAFVMNLYQKENFDKLRGIYGKIQAGDLPGMVGVSDMTLLHLFHEHIKKTGSHFAQLETYSKNGRFDHNINVGEGFLHDGVRKIVTFKDGTPYGYLQSGSRVRLHTLHFQGAKYPINEYSQVKLNAEDIVEYSIPSAVGLKLDELIDLSNRETHYHLGNGWAGPEGWGVCARGESSYILFDLEGADHESELVVELRAKVTYERVPWQTSVSINNRPLGVLSFDEPGMLTKRIKFSRNVGETRFKLGLHHDDVPTPRDLGFGDDWRDITIGVEAFKVTSEK